MQVDRPLASLALDGSAGCPPPLGTPVTARLSIVSDPMTPLTPVSSSEPRRRRAVPHITDGRVIAALTATWALLAGAWQLL